MLDLNQTVMPDLVGHLKRMKVYRIYLFATLLLLIAAGQSAWAAVTGSGTQGDPFVVDSWADLKDKMAAGGYIRLGANVTDPEKTSSSYLSVPSGVTVTLDLAGHTINRGLTSAIDNGYVISVVGTLTVSDSSSPSTGKITHGWTKGKGGGVYVANSGIFTMISGEISDNTASDNGSYNLGSGGGVCVDGGTFNLDGGRISGNSVKYGGGVYVNSGTFTVTGGEISGNTAHYNGGGVYVSSGCTFSLSGNPVIRSNTLDNSNHTPHNVGLSNNVFITLTDALTDGADIHVYRKTGVVAQGDGSYTPTAADAAKFTCDQAHYGPRLNGSYQVEMAQFFAVTLSATTGGSLTATVGVTAVSSGDHVFVDDEVTLTLSPAEGYSINTVSYNDGSDHEILPVNDIYSFTMPAADVTVSATFTKTPVTTSYIDADGTLHENIVAIPLDNIMTTLAAGTYVVNSDVTYTSGITLNGNVTLILENGKTMNVGTSESRVSGSGIDYNSGSPSLTIYGQTKDNQIAGNLNIYTTISNGIVSASYAQYGGNVNISPLGMSSCIYAVESDITINGGTLNATSGGNAIYADQGTITLGCTTASDGITASGYSGTVKVADGKSLVYVSNDKKLTIIGTLTAAQIADIKGKALTKGMSWADLKTALHAGQSVTLTNNVTRDVSESISVAGTVTLDLNGYRIDGNAPTNYNDILQVGNNVNLTITDSSIGQTGSIGNVDSWGAISIFNGGSVTLAAGTIDGNAYAVRVNYGSSFTMTGGTLTGAPNGVELDDNATFTMSGGVITGNQVGVNALSSPSGTFTVNGNVNITGNTVKDVFLYFDSNFNPIHIGGKLNDAARIGIDILDAAADAITGDVVKVFTDGLEGYGTKQNFVLNGRDGHALVTKADGEVAIAVAYTLTVPDGVTASGLTPISANTYKVGCSDVVTLNATAGYGITTASYNDGSSDYDIDPVQGVYSFAMPASDATVTVTISDVRHLTLVQGAKDGVTAWWGTFYSGTVNYTLDEGAAAYTMGTDFKLYRLGTDGRVIPAGTAVVIIAAEATPVTPATDPATATITLTPVGAVSATDNAPGSNILTGVDVDTVFPSIFVLSVNAGAVDFRKLASGTLPAHKAGYEPQAGMQNYDKQNTQEW